MSPSAFCSETFHSFSFCHFCFQAVYNVSWFESKAWGHLDFCHRVPQASCLFRSSSSTPSWDAVIFQYIHPTSPVPDTMVFWQMRFENALMSGRVCLHSLLFSFLALSLCCTLTLQTPCLPLGNRLGTIYRDCLHFRNRCKESSCLCNIESSVQEHAIWRIWVNCQHLKIKMWSRGVQVEFAATL